MTYYKRIALFASVALTAGGLVAFSAPASAQGQQLVIVSERADNPVRRVSLKDLNLATAEGEKILSRRVRRAVSSACHEAVGHRLNLQADQSCRDLAWDGAKPQMALAVQRAREIAATGGSKIAPVAISIVAVK